VSALTRGMVTVGGVACAVNGMAAPSRIKLIRQSDCRSRAMPGINEPLNKSHGAILSKHKVASQSIHDHEYDLVERRIRYRAEPFLSIGTIIPICKTGQYRLVREEASCEHQDRNREKEVGKSETGHAQTARRNHASR